MQNRNEQRGMIQFFQPQIVVDSQPTFIKTSLANLENMKNKIKNRGLSVYQAREMNGIPNNLPFVMQLGGRGQDGFAGFFGQQDDLAQQHLIKIDDPATCILEGTAKFAQNLLLPGHESAVNFASTGVMCVTKPEQQESETHIVSIQNRVAPRPNHTIQAWDVVVYGSKRNPKSWVSTEYLNQNKIKKNIAAMTEKAQWDLANALFISTVVGDESLHVGQFMAELDETGTVTGITRIDFGARERYGAARYNKSDFQHQTSKLYKNSGQKGKDYISYLLNSPDVRAKYLSLWSRELDIEATAANHAQVFLQELKKLPEESQQTALDDIIKTIYKKSGKNIQGKLEMNLGDKRKHVALLLQVIAKRRINSMQTSARQLLSDEIIAQQEATGTVFSSKNKQIIQDLVTKSDEETENNLQTMNDYLTEKALKCTPQQAQHYQQIAQILIERQSMAKHTTLSSQMRKGINTQLMQMQLINQRLNMIAALTTYQSHLNGKIKGADEKKEQVRLALLMLQAPGEELNQQFAYEPQQIFDAKFCQTVAKRRINPNKETKSHGAELIDDLTAMMEKYQRAKQPEQVQVEIQKPSNSLLM